MKTLYDSLAERLPDPDFIFFNYGFADLDSPGYEWIRESDQRYKYHLSLIRRVLRGVDLDARVVLEVGSGRGGNCLYLSRYTRAARIVGLDLCRAGVRFARQHPHPGHVSFVQGDAQRLPFLDRTFDIALNVESSHCYQDFDRFVSEVRRVLAPRGIFCLADLWALDALSYDWDQRKKALYDPGFALLSEEDISEQVFRALKSEDGLTRALREASDPACREFIDRIIKGAEALRLHLALGQCSYKIWRLQKQELS